MKTIIMVRHGQSETNVLKVFTGQIDAALTDTGREQAQMMAQYLDKYKVDKIYVSSLSRALETAQPIAQRQNCPVEKRDDLMEINAGLWQGMTFTDIAEKYPETYRTWKEDTANAAPEGGETCRQLYERATVVLKEVLEAPEEIVCLVCHATTIRMMESYIRCGCAEAAQSISALPNASVAVYEYDGRFKEIERGSCDFLGGLCTKLPKTI